MKNGAEPIQEARHEQSNLDRQYGDIGISALVAALHYPSETKNPAYAPVRSQAIEPEAA